MVEIPLPGGMAAIVDDEDLPLINRHIWHLRPSEHSGYAYAAAGGTTIAMHRVIMGAVRGQIVDHANGNGLDNRRANLRFCTPSLNCANVHTGPRGVVRFHGVVLSGKPNLPYRVRIRINHIKRSGGYFACAIEAAKAYDALAFKHFGEFATLNFPADYLCHRQVEAAHTSTSHEQAAARQQPAAEGDRS